MADYIAHTRTNYFQVTDLEKLKKILAESRVTGCNAEPISLIAMDEKEVKPDSFVAFLCPGTIEGYPIPRDEEDDCNLTQFLYDISDILDPGQACIITEVGHEKYRIINAYTIVVCPGHKVKYLSMNDLSVQCARETLNDPEYNPRMDC